MNMRVRRLSLFATVLSASLAWAGPAEVEPGAPSSVTIQVLVIAASNTGEGVDPRLEKLQKRLKDFSFSSYQVLTEQTLTLDLNSEEKIALPGGRSLEITPRKFEKSGKIRIHLHVLSESQAKLVDAEYAIEPGGDLLVGGMKHGDGSLLIALHHGAK